MQRTQIYITESQDKGLKRLAKRRRQKQSELIREALDAFLMAQDLNGFHQRARDAAGLWADRPHLAEDMAALRQELDRSA